MPEEQLRPTGRPRDPAVSKRLITAALEEYARTGWESFTMQGVARRAGVGKSALYRRWTTKEQLLIAAVESIAIPLATTTDSGSLRDDLTELATRHLRHFLDPTGWATLRISVDFTTDLAILGLFQERITETIRSGIATVFTRAIDRGEIGSDVPIGPLTQALIGSILVHVLSMPFDERDDARRNAVAHVEPLVEAIIRSATYRHSS